MNCLARAFTVSILWMLSLTHVSAETILTAVLNQGSDAEKSVSFTVEELLAIGSHTLETGNDYVEGKKQFTGPLVRDVFAHLGVEEVKLARMTAANDYSVEITADEFEKYDVIFALNMDGTRLSMRDKGPIWLMYPVSDHEELQKPIYNSRLIWQLVEVVIE